MKFANVFLDIEYMITQEINSKLAQTSLIEDWFNLRDIAIDWLEKEVEVNGYDKMQGEEFVLYYNYENKTGKVQYHNGHIEYFKS